MQKYVHDGISTKEIIEEKLNWSSGIYLNPFPVLIKTE